MIFDAKLETLGLIRRSAFGPRLPLPPQPEKATVAKRPGPGQGSSRLGQAVGWGQGVGLGLAPHPIYMASHMVGKRRFGIFDEGRPAAIAH